VAGGDIALILYELFQAAYERIEAAMYYLPTWRTAKTYNNMELVDSDYIDYYLPKYNGELVTTVSDFNGIPMHSLEILDIVATLRDCFNVDGTQIVYPIWPNSEEIEIDTTPDTILNSMYWRAVMAYVASHRSIRNQISSATTVRDSIAEHTSIIRFDGYILSGSEYVNLQGLGRWFLDTNHIVTGYSSATSNIVKGLSYGGSSSSSGTDNRQEVLDEVKTVKAAIDRIGNLLGQPNIVAEETLPYSTVGGAPHSFYNVCTNENENRTYEGISPYNFNFQSLDPDFPQIGFLVSKPGITESNIVRFPYFQSKRLTITTTYTYDTSSPGIKRGARNGQYFTVRATQTSICGSDTIVPAYNDLKDYVEYGLDNWYPLSVDPYFAAPTEEFIPYTY
jgi:hypothetical protein